MKFPRQVLAFLCALALLCALVACGPEALPEETAEPTTVDITTMPQEEEAPADEPMGPSYVLTDTHFYAVGTGDRDGTSDTVYYASLDDLSQVRRIPSPLHYEGKKLWGLRFDRVDEQWIYLIALTGNDHEVDGYTVTYKVDFYVQMRISLDTFICEFLGTSDALPSTEPISQATKPPRNDSEQALLSGNENLLDVLALDSKHFCLEIINDYRTGVIELSLYRLEKNGTVVDLSKKHSNKSLGGKLELLNGMMLWTNDTRFVYLYDPVSGKAFSGSDYWYSGVQNETRPRPDYEFTLSYAKTPTHIFASRDGELYHMPLKDIAQQEKIPLPQKFDSLGISGLTEQFLFVSGGRMDDNDYLQSAVVYQISLKTLKVEQIDDSKTSVYPRYNAAGNSLLYIRQKKDETNYPFQHWVEAFDLDTGKRQMIFDFSGYFFGDSWVRGWHNAPNGETVLDILGNWWDGPFYCVAVGKDNAVRLMSTYDWPRWEEEAQPEPPPRGKLETALSENEDIQCIAAHGGYIYYVETVDRKEAYYGINNLYRVDADGSNKKLLRAKTNIFSLWSEGGSLLCLAYLPDEFFYGESYGFYVLGEDGKVTQTIAHGYYGEWGDTVFERLYGLILISSSTHGTAENILSTIYHPATAATFHAYTKEGN